MPTRLPMLLKIGFILIGWLICALGVGILVGKSIARSAMLEEFDSAESGESIQRPVAAGSDDQAGWTRVPSLPRGVSTKPSVVS